MSADRRDDPEVERLQALEEELAAARERVAALERLIRQERAQYLAEQRRAASAMEQLRSSPDQTSTLELERSRAEIKELLRYKRQVERLESSPLYGPASRAWRRFKAIRGYEQKVG